MIKDATLPYHKDPKEEVFLKEFNMRLREDPTKYIEYPDGSFIFIVGLPRSGTTLLSQLVSYCLDVGYFSNFIARFWLAPITGIRLSKILFGAEKPSNFVSDYGTTIHPMGIHSFHYFWQYWLSLPNHDIDWSGLRRTLSNIHHEFKKPITARGIFVAEYLPQIFDILPKALFLYIKRDSLDVAVSILNVRRQCEKSVDNWWGHKPPEYSMLKSLSHLEQIASQVYYLRKFYKEKFRAIGYKNTISIQYEDLCRNPHKILRLIQCECDKIHKVVPRITATPPNMFTFRHHAEVTSETKKLASLLRELEYGE